MSRRYNQNGYVLLLVLWAMVVMSIFASRALDMLSDAQNAALRDGEALAAEQDINNTLSHVLFLVARQQGELRGLPTGAGHLRVDGTVYAGIGDARFNVIDQHALLNINSLNLRQAEQLFGQLAGNGSVRQFQAQIEDYIDIDDWPEAGGAEAFHYQAQQSLGPANTNFRSPEEMWALPIFQQTNAPLIDADTVLQLTTIGAGRINVNAAPESLVASLDSLYGMNLTPLRQRLEAGEVIAGLPDLKRVLSLPLNWPVDYNQVSFGLSRYVRVNLWHKRSASLTEFNLINTPNKPSPWRIVYVRKHPIPEQWSDASPDDKFRQAIPLQTSGATR